MKSDCTFLDKSSKTKMTDLEIKIKEAAQKYYTDGSSDLTDAEFDKLIDQLYKENPDSELLKRTGWGYSITEDITPGKKYLHRYGEAGSLEKCRTWDEIRPEYKCNPIDISAKLDGLSVVLYYKDGVLDQALTRGDGRVGIDITDKIKAILGDSIPDKSFTGGVRGEILITNDNFKEFQQLHPEAKNPRNSAAGLINGKEITDDFRYLNVVVYSVVGADSWYPEGAMIPMSKVREWLSCNFRLTAPNMSTIHINSITFLENFDKLRAVWSRTYPIDGLVLTLNFVRFEPGNCVIQKSQAFKFKSETDQTEVLEVEWNMSKTGYAIPRVRVEPVQLAGTNVQYCTGYNAKYISDNNIGVGAIIEIEKRGEIIPNINKVVAISYDPYLPTFCPYCNCELQFEGPHLVCKNPNCNNSVLQDTIIWTNTLAPVNNLGESLKEKFLTETYGDIPSIEDLMSKKPIAYTISPNGLDIQCKSEFSNKVTFLPRFGIRLFIPKVFDKVEYYGYGPYESYIDKHQSSYMGNFSARICDMHEDYIRPQENSSHFGCKHMTVTDGNVYIKFTAAEDFSFNASEYTQEELSAKRHNFELEKSESNIICIDSKMAGVGSNACGPVLAEKYRLTMPVISSKIHIEISDIL